MDVNEMSFDTEKNTNGRAQEAVTLDSIGKKGKKSKKEKKRKKNKRLFSWSFWIIFAVVFFNSFNIIQEGFIGVSKRFGKAQAILPPGFHAKIPFIDSVTLLDTRIRLFEQETQATNADHIEVKLKLSANWHFPATSAALFYQKYGTEKQYEQRVLLPLLTSTSHGFISQYTTSELLGKRALISGLIANAISRNNQLSPAILDNVQIVKFTLPEAYQKGLEEKLAQQQILETEKLKANKDKIKAQADSDIAEIKANALIKQSEANAKAMLIKGEAKASVIKKIIRAIQDNRNYIQYEKIQKWDGKLSSNTTNPNRIFKSIEK